MADCFEALRAPLTDRPDASALDCGDAMSMVDFDSADFGPDFE